MADSGSTTGTPIGGGAVLGTDGVGLEPTLLGHYRYAQIMGIDAPHFCQMDGALSPLRGGCDDLWDQDDREALVDAIMEAESLIADVLGTWPAPKWITCEQQRVGRVRDDWWNAEFKTKYGRVERFGTQTLTLLEADAPVAYSNDDADPLGREETATVGGAGVYYYITACATACATKVYFRVADGAWDAADPRFEIRNLRYDIDDAIMYVKGESSYFVQPALWLLTRADCYGTEDWKHDFATTNLVSAVDVYCESTNTTLPAALSWDGLDACTSAPCAFEAQDACAQVTDYERGHFMFRPATGANAWAAALYAQPPTKITYSYKAGWPLDARTCRMDPRLERAIVKLTNALLPEPPCGFCDAARTRWENDRKNVDPLIEAATRMPWDLFSRGAYEAYKIVNRMARGHGGTVRG